MANNEAFSSIGTRMAFSIGVPATLDVAGYAALTYTDWDRLSTIGDIGPEDNLIEWTPVGSGIVEKIAAERNNGSQDMEAAHVPTNDGQILFVTAFLSRTTLSVRESLPSGDILYYRAVPLSAKIGVGDASGYLKIMPKMSVSGAIVTDDTGVAAA